MAKITVRVKAPTPFEVDVEAYSLTYDCATGAFFMTAAEHDIAPDRLYKPMRLHLQYGVLFIRFETTDEANQFVDWVKEANAEAEHSFRHMGG